MHRAFPHNILKQKKKMGRPLFLVRGDVGNITYPVSQRGRPFFRYVSSLAGSLRISYNYFDLDFGRWRHPFFRYPRRGRVKYNLYRSQKGPSLFPPPRPLSVADFLSPSSRTSPGTTPSGPGGGGPILFSRPGRTIN